MPFFYQSSKNYSLFCFRFQELVLSISENCWDDLERAEELDNDIQVNHYFSI